MRRVIPLSIALTLTLALVIPASGEAQQLRLPALDGGEITEAELGRGTHLIVFWTTWAPRGRDVVDRVNTLVESWGGQASVHTVNFQEDEAAVRGFLRGQAALKAKVYLDGNGDFSKKHRVNGAPWLLILKDGRTSFSEKLPDSPDAVISQILG